MPAADSPGSQGGGLLSSLRRLAATCLEMVHTRLEILASELEEERARLGSMLMTCALAFFFFFMAAILFTFLIVVLLWDSHRVPALGIMGALFLAAGVLCWRSFQRQRSDRPILEATLGEFAKDRRELTSR